MIGREVEEWIGATPDTPVPPRVRLRVWERHGGRCYLSGRKIRIGEPWDVDHIVALCNGGEHKESNLAPVLRDKHREKTAADVTERARIDRIRKRHLGLKKKSRLSPPPDAQFDWSRGRYVRASADQRANQLHQPDGD